MITFIYLNVTVFSMFQISATTIRNTANIMIGHKEWINVLMLKPKVNDACRQMIYELDQNVEPLIFRKKCSFIATQFA